MRTNIEYNVIFSAAPIFIPVYIKVFLSLCNGGFRL